MQGKALGKQQQDVAAAVAAAAEARRQWLAKLVSMEQLLYSAQSAQFLDIRKREAEAFKVCTFQPWQQQESFPDLTLECLL